MSTTPPPRCLEPEEMAELMDGTLSGPAREAALAHVDTCFECHEWLSESARSLEAQGERRAPALSRWWPALVGLAAAAGLAAFLVRSAAHAPGVPVPPAVRADRTETPAPAPPSLPPASPERSAAEQLLSLAPASTLLPHAWDPQEAGLGYGPVAVRKEALMAGVYQTDLDVALAASAQKRARALQEQVASRAKARAAEPAAFTLGATLEAARLAAAVRAEAFFQKAVTAERLSAAARGEPDAVRRRELRRLAALIRGGRTSGQAWQKLQSALDDVLRLE